MSGFLGLLPLDGLATLLGGIIAAIVTGAALYWRGRSAGRSGAETKAKEQDNARAAEIETAADRARAADDAGDGNSIERLRESGRLRRD